MSRDVPVLNTRFLGNPVAFLTKSAIMSAGFVIVIIIPFISILLVLADFVYFYANTSSRVCPGSLGTPALITIISASLQSL